MSPKTIIVILSGALCIAASAARAELGKLFVHPGHEGSFTVTPTTSKPANIRQIGKIGGRAVSLIDTPSPGTEMGKQMVVASDGAVWFVMTREDKVVRIDPKSLVMTSYSMPEGSGPYSVAIDGNDTLWMTAHGIEMLLEFKPKENLVITHQPPGHGFLVHINVDPWRNIVYFSQPGSNKVVRYSREGGFREYSIPTAESGPARLAVQSDGTVWFPELYANKLARLNPETGDIKEWNLPTADGFPAYARVARDGSIWMSQPMADRIVRFDPKNEQFKEFVVPTKNSIVSTQVEDENGNIWFTQGGWRGSAGGNKIAVLHPDGKFEELSIPVEHAQPAGITMTKEGEVWFQLSAKGTLARVEAVASKS